MSLTGFSLGMYIFHFEAFPLSAGKSRFQFQATNLHTFGLVGKVGKLLDHSYCIFDHGLGLWPAPDSSQSQKLYNSGHDGDGALSIRNFRPKRAYHSIFNRCFFCFVIYFF
jgi:hypothetical protein